MAIAFVKASILSRASSRRSVAAHIAYRAGLRLEGTGDYSNRKPTVISEFFIGWKGTHQEFAKTVEVSERRKDAQLVRELEWALPHDANDEQREQIVRKYAQELRDRYGVAIHAAIHRPRAKDEHASGMKASGLNYHAHLTVTLRPVSEDGKFGAKKLREMNDRGWLDSQKDRMTELVNTVAQEKASRALKYGVVVPTVGLAWHLERRGETTTLGERHREFEEKQAMKAELEHELYEREISRAELERAVEIGEREQRNRERESTLEVARNLDADAEQLDTAARQCVGEEPARRESVDAGREAAGELGNHARPVGPVVDFARHDVGQIGRSSVPGDAGAEHAGAGDAADNRSDAQAESPRRTGVSAWLENVRTLFESVCAWTGHVFDRSEEERTRLRSLANENLRTIKHKKKQVKDLGHEHERGHSQGQSLGR